MKLSKLALLATFAVGIYTGSATAQQATTGPFGQIQQVGCFDDDCCEPECGCEATYCDDYGCDGCGDGSSCCGNAGTLLGDGTMPTLCCSPCGGDPWQLCGSHWGWDKGGWLQIGYHSEGRGGNNFNDHPDQVNLHQAWFFMEKVADGSSGFDFGGRVDYVYGVDAQNTQAFGIPDNHWDNSWDNGIYGHAIPQLYGELAYGNMSVKVGHFYTIIGYEVVTAPDNFFYSHAWTMNNSEPFTHTGALATYQCDDATTIYAGYTLGWDSGFKDNGDVFIGGISRDMNDTTNVTVAYVGGRFNERFGMRGAEDGNMFSVVVQKSCTDNLRYIFQYDYLNTEAADTGIVCRDTNSINQYLIYNINDCWAIGARAEWWNIRGQAYTPANPSNNQDIYDLTVGINYRGNPNWIVRPEVRFTRHNARNRVNFPVNANAAGSQTTFGIDGIYTF